MHDWFISQQDDDIWMSGAWMDTKEEVLDKVRKLKPDALNHPDSFYQINVIDKKTRSYYLISLSITSYDEQKLKKWAKSQTAKHDDYYHAKEMTPSIKNQKKWKKAITLVAAIGGISLATFLGALFLTPTANSILPILAIMPIASAVSELIMLALSRASEFCVKTYYHTSTTPNEIEIIENNGTRTTDNNASTTNDTSAQELESLYEDIHNLETDTLADNKISKLVKDKIDSINSSYALQTNINYKNLIKEFKEIKNALTHLKNDDEGIRESLKDLNDVALMKSKL